MTPLPPELVALLTSVASEPDDDAPRLALADWLEEQGETARAELVRIQTRTERLLKKYVEPTTADRDRTQRRVILSDDGPEWRTLKRRERELRGHHGREWREGAPSAWRVNFVGGLLSVKAEVSQFLGPRGSGWWDARRHWVSELTLVGCDDDAIEQIAPRLSHLRALVLEKSHLRLERGRRTITDEGVKALSHLRQLTELRLARQAVTDAGINFLTALQRLRALDLTSTRVGDEGLRYVSWLRELRWLNLCFTGVTDTGLRHLAKLARLRVLWLGGYNKRYTMEAADELQAALPQCDIRHNR
jgi:uncharacterized protein (TIGR02996 family)